MAQRAMGTMPAVQPLMTPSHAQMREDPRGAAAELGMTAEIETIAPVPAGKGDARRRPVADRDSDVQQQAGEPDNRFVGRSPGKRSRAPEKIAKAHEAAMPVSAPADLGERQSSPLRRAAQPGVERRREVAAGPGPERAAELRPAKAGHRSQTARTARAGQRAEPMEPRREDATADRMKEERETSGIGIVLSPKDEPSQLEIVQSSASPKRDRLVAELPLKIDRRGTPQRELRAAEEKTEIHISIGSIELRAPRAEQRPQAAPFRPRVTLDEFLRRGQETRP
jgi:hypothetical protein